MSTPKESVVEAEIVETPKKKPPIALIVIGTLILLAGIILTILYFLGVFNKCKKVKCENGGTCKKGKCECVTGFMGEKCENPCDASFTGPNCETSKYGPEWVGCFIGDGGTSLKGYEWVGVLEPKDFGVASLNDVQWSTIVAKIKTLAGWKSTYKYVAIMGTSPKGTGMYIWGSETQPTDIKVPNAKNQLRCNFSFANDSAFYGCSLGSQIPGCDKPPTGVTMVGNTYVVSKIDS